MYIDLLIKIKNAERSGKRSLKTRYSRMDYAVLEELKRYGFVKKMDIKGRPPKKIIEVSFSKDRPIEGIKFLSRPSVRRYGGYKKFKPVKSGHGIMMVSTPKGIMSGVRAKKNKLGGQTLFEIW
ncbi:30S ribosomal protein S8 [Candidatus Jorgensenbacteria bacterium RIFCSPLOWO2_02_FULL_45_12]|uniref:Small ribosomal subunit protein uS8 n=2 Tax=Candidatus Joergenseniibacteriota TaxID=1752739 RepID=A0A1F6BPU5_9BACT|nr:MAG: 30S ribosomal protein S8 [Candidatus Jorgensenbacteria bacterium GW2011_GWA2_45_9]OGG38945.1 MAG: 30S ribosomal protein S8 [Candidatus Jorgensenbacteria bacterium RIFCSPHIGHO2_02_FULL_45_20]OGG42704.1 MAG: 30S ribosomal protein S8 [Candidatus Jorgensenbacteria bacterium RIFCSPLOWO2_02_FULL_45_12]